MNVPPETIRAYVRRMCNVYNNAVPVHIVDDSHKPVITGKEGGHFTLGGNRITYPSAYAKVGFSNMCYICDSRVIYVGQGWIEQCVTTLLKGIRMMAVILHYDSGHPTRLVKHKRLAERGGPPVRIEGWTLHWCHAVGCFASAWHYHLKSPYPGEKRQLVRVSISSAVDWKGERQARLDA